MDAKEPGTTASTSDSPVSPAGSAGLAPGARRPPRRVVTYAIMTGAALTLFGVIGLQRQSKGGPGPSRPLVTAPAPRAPEPAEPLMSEPVLAPAPQAARPQVELVFALDTTSSMSNLIEGAKQKIWSLASFVAQGQPTPDLRIGLVGFRDVGDAYVTKVYDLDADLDRVYRRLRAFRAEGGGDTPEHVARALDEAVRKMSWSQAASVVKVIYLVGDAPPHTDYADGYDVARAARAAKNKGIQLHTIQCGTDDATQTVWRRLAGLGGGQFMAIHQDGGMHEERTRYDDELAALDDKLTETAIGYGAGRGSVAAAAREAAAAPVSVKAARASFMARKGKAVAAKGDLIEALGSGAVRLDEVQVDLPPEMKAMSKPEQEKTIAAKQKERAEVTRRIEELSKLRRAELDAREKSAAAAGVADGFDVAAKKALRSSVKANATAGLDL
jgi:hypothetical protein